MSVQKSYTAFRDEYIGKAIDLDGYPPQQPYQCWDGANQFFLYVDGHIIHCGQTGYVKDIANMRNSNGILNFCDDVGLHEELQPGDICIWTNCPNCPWSHIAMYDHDDGQNAVYFLGQNQPKPYMTIERIGVAGIIGVFRPKIFVGNNPNAPEVDVDEPTADQILHYGSKVISGKFIVERLSGNNFYSSIVGGWVPAADVDEVSKRDGKKDQILHVGSEVKFNKGKMTVTGLAYNNIVTLDKLSYPIKADVLIEVKK